MEERAIDTKGMKSCVAREMDEESSSGKLITDISALPSISHMEQTRDTAKKVFKELNKTFDTNLVAGRLMDGEEIAAASEQVDNAFNNLLEAHAEVVAAKGGGW